VVGYYDKEVVEASIDMLNGDSDEIERSGVSEVKKWIVESNSKSR
jgi:hypothetical protein